MLLKHIVAPLFSAPEDRRRRRSRSTSSSAGHRERSEKKEASGVSIADSGRAQATKSLNKLESDGAAKKQKQSASTQKAAKAASAPKIQSSVKKDTKSRGRSKESLPDHTPLAPRRTPGSTQPSRTPCSSRWGLRHLTILPEDEREVPTIHHVKHLLTTGGFQFALAEGANGKYTFPNGDVFTSEDEFRAHFCANGLGEEPTDQQLELFGSDTKEARLLERWVRLSVVSSSLRTLPKEIDLASKIYNEVMALGFKESGMGYYFPLAKENDTVWRQHGGFVYCIGYDSLYVKLSQYGLPKECLFDAIDEEARSRVELHLAFLQRDLLNPNP